MRLYEPFYKFFFILILLCPSVLAEAQTLNFKQLTVNDGLLSSTVYYTYQDSRGFMWFATESGVNRYDGSKFEAISLDDGLTDNEVLWIQEDSQGRMWFLTLNGQLCYYHNNKIYNPSNNAILRKASPKASVISFYEDSKKQIWLGTTQQEMVLIGKGFVRFYKLPAKYFLANSFVTEDRTGKVWILNDRNAFSVSGKNLIQEKLGEFPVSPRSFYKDHATGRTLFISQKGLVEFINGKTRLIRRLEPEIIKQGLGHFFIDNDNSIWVSTLGHGITRFNRRNEANNYLPGLYVSHTIKDRGGNIWISTIGDGVYFLSENSKNIKQYTERFGLSDGAVHSIARDQNGLIWLGLRSGGVNFLSAKGMSYRDLRISPNPYNPIKSLKVDSVRRSIWFATNNSLGEVTQDLSRSRHLRDSRNVVLAIKSFSLSKDGQLAFASSSGVYILHDRNRPLIFRGSTNIPGIQKYFPVRGFHVFFDSRNTLWFSNIKGLFRYENNILSDLTRLSPVLGKRITDMKELPDGSIAVATYGYGIVLIKDNKVLHHFTAQKGMTSNIVTRIRVQNNLLWASTTKGITKIRIDGHRYHIDRYQTEEGLGSNEVHDLLVDRDQIYVASNSGLTVLEDRAHRTDTLPPPLYLTSIRIGDRTITDTSNLQLRHTDNNIRVQFTAINYNTAHDILYRYRLRPNDPYTQIRNNSIDFASLEPGDYNLQIEVRSQSSPWSKPLTLNFSVYPPFWKSLGFIILTTLLTAALVMQGLRSYFRAQRMHEEEELLVQNKIIALEQQALQAMMNPHFVFNVMNSIQHFINTRNDLAANKVLTGFARLIRTNMEVCTKSFITLEEEIESLKLYLSLESLRFGDRLKYTIETEEGIDTEEVFLPSMLLQPFVENAIWHGIMPKESGGRIEIHISRQEEDSIVIDIIDDGIGILNGKRNREKEHVSRGMQLTNDRIKLLNKTLKKPILLNVDQLGDFGTRVNFIIPLV